MMTYVTPERRTPRDVEDALGLDHLDELLAERARLVGLNAQLGALYGPFGTFEAHRKQYLAVLSLEKREDASIRTDKAVEEASHADQRYLQFLTKATRERAQFLVNADAITAIDARIHSRQGMLRFAASEARL